MILGCIADDFTGASDLGNLLSRGGLRTVQFVGVPTGPAPDSDAGIVALKTRSIPVAEAIAQSREALAWLRGQGCRQFVFKYCSTFDSTPEGNIGPVAEGLARDLGVRGVVVCPTSIATRRTVYQGHLFVEDHLLNESGMVRHPLNPMTDPDLRRWLALQTEAPVGHVDYPSVRRGRDSIRQALAAAARRGETLVVVDAIVEEDLRAIGRACWDAPLVTGGSGVALALPDTLAEQGLAKKRQMSHFDGLGGPAVVLCGSCSDATLRQITEYGATHPVFRVDIDAVMRGRQTAAELAAVLLGRADEGPLLASSENWRSVARTHAQHGSGAVAGRLEALFGEIASRLVAAGVERLVVAGGETSGAVVTELQLRMLSIGPEIDPGVPALRSLDGGGGVALALKSGNLGRPDFFARATEVLGRRPVPEPGSGATR